jgi:hypothetical protein
MGDTEFCKIFLGQGHNSYGFLAIFSSLGHLIQLRMSCALESLASGLSTFDIYITLYIYTYVYVYASVYACMCMYVYIYVYVCVVLYV